MNQINLDFLYFDNKLEMCLIYYCPADYQSSSTESSSRHSSCSSLASYRGRSACNSRESSYRWLAPILFIMSSSHFFNISTISVHIFICYRICLLFSIFGEKMRARSAIFRKVCFTHLLRQSFF
jgi:hypothetical protein